ncbi:hypothetical protein HPP92_010314 [Vanilla planifolia]|uniref:Uncharacterized protein n=1 Tax=Vanilla planifolia TaxID=51239 RepID=A0A835V1I8_VANPL|nr:hypothetical protein HPP92_010524 [Vanilla planifolia]KAG0482230.1 hypothetical protein HPP92_010314 [Vanilla planifolia]
MCLARRRRVIGSGSGWEEARLCKGGRVMIGDRGGTCGSVYVQLGQRGKNPSLGIFGQSAHGYSKPDESHLDDD